MGSHSSKDLDNKSHYEIIVKTGDVKGAGTDANVFISLLDENGKRSKDIKLDCRWRDDFEKGSIDNFKVTDVNGLGDIVNIELWRDKSGINDDWFVEWIRVRQIVGNRTSSGSCTGGIKIDTFDGFIPFPCNRWIIAGKKFSILKYDSVLPQFDPRREQRANELESKKEKYKFMQRAPGMPKQVEDCPREESFSNDYKWDITQLKIKLLARKNFTKLLTGKWQDLDDMTNVYRGAFDVPKSHHNWQTDAHFGRQRVQGCNPTLLQLCKEIPEKLAITEEMIQPFTEGLTIDEAISQKRLYFVDLHSLDGIECSNDRVLCVPIALFFVTKNGDLMPVAIQLFQEPGDDNPVFLPSDPKYTWMLVKMYFNNSDAAIHQACTHLGFTHLIAESICVAFHRSLSPSHPIFRLLAPHFLYLIAINSLALTKLVSPGGWIDCTMTMGSCGMFNIVSKRWANWRMDVEGWLPAELESRGVADTKALPYYPYRDDALLLHDAIKDYVGNVVTSIYDTPEKLLEDHEIQAWAKTLSHEEEFAIKGVPGDGSFTTVDDVIQTVTSVIFLSSVGHAAANFNQYDEYGFPPNYPGILLGNVPRTKVPLEEKDIIDHLPDKNVTLDIMVVTKILSDRGTNGLADFEVQYQYNPEALKAVEKFKEELDKASEKILQFNKDRDVPYEYLDPKEVPNAISI